MASLFLLETTTRRGVFTQKQLLWSAMEEISLTDDNLKLVPVKETTHHLAPAYRALCDMLRKHGDLTVKEDDEVKAYITILPDKNTLKIVTQATISKGLAPIDDLDGEYTIEEMNAANPGELDDKITDWIKNPKSKEDLETRKRVLPKSPKGKRVVTTR